MNFLIILYYICFLFVKGYFLIYNSFLYGSKFQHFQANSLQLAAWNA